MDYNILYLFALIILGLGLIVGVVYFKKKYNVSTEQLTDGVDLSKTISKILKITAKELNIVEDEMVEKVANIVEDTLDYIKTINIASTKEEKVNAGIKYIEDNSESFGIEIDEDLLYVCSTLLGIGINLLESLEVK
jgi:hypothetical protein